MDLKVTLTVQMQAPHSDFLRPSVAPAVVPCKNHNSHFCTLLLGTLLLVGSLCGTAVKPHGPSEWLGHSCHLGLYKSLMSLLQDSGCRLLICHMFTSPQTYNLLSTDFCPSACQIKDNMYGLSGLLPSCNCICTNYCCAM